RKARLRADGTGPARARGRPARLARVCEGRRGGRRVIERYLGALAAELGSVGIRGAQRRRILAEVEDHLRESGDPARFGEPALIGSAHVLAPVTWAARMPNGV